MKKFKLVVSAVLAVFLCITVAPAAFAMGANENVGSRLLHFLILLSWLKMSALKKVSLIQMGIWP